jgi:hypothetical protein
MTDRASAALVDALDAMSNVTNEQFVKRVRELQSDAFFEMNKAMAAQLLKGFRPQSK